VATNEGERDDGTADHHKDSSNNNDAGTGRATNSATTGGGGREMKDILDLCRLNLMEEHIEDSTALDRDSTLAAIDIARRRVIAKIEPAETGKE